MSERELFDLYKKEIYKTCYYMLQNQADAEDVCQEVFISAFKHDWRRVEFVKTWLLRIAVNQCMNHLKKQSRAREKIAALFHSARQDTHRAAESIVMDQVGWQECVDLLHLVPVKMRSALLLRYMHDYSLNEVAEILDIPVGTVKSRLNKGLALLRNRLEHTGMYKNGRDLHGQSDSAVIPYSRT
ncbi:RNA polymerase sigma factor [Paenibacillus gansuensis]|uniref:RNA polymerase sigma factor n=1 Tax=Paenibacillus gansuensis TaxID=306542 RepID=A0ABW5PAK3_9BACL